MGDSLALSIVIGLKDAASEGLKGIFGKIAVAAGAVMAAKAGFDFLKDSVAAAAAEEAGIAALGAAVSNTGADWDTASAAIETYLAKQLSRTALDDGEGRAAIQKLTETTGDYQTALNLMTVTQDMAAATGMSLESAAAIVGRVHEGNTGILSRYGIVVEEGATAQDALAEMQTKFAGQAEAYGSTYEGAMKKFDIATGNIKETIGAALIPVLTSMMNGIVDLAMRAIPWIQRAIEDLQPVFDAIIEAVRVGVAWIQAFWSEHGEQIIGIVTTLWETIKTIFEAAFKVIVDVFNVFAAVFAGDWAGAWEAVKKLFVDKWELIKKLFTGILDVIASLFGTTTQDILGAIGDFGTKSLAAIKKPFQDAYDWLKNLWNDIKNFIVHIFDGVKIPLPHFSVNWTEVLGVRIPSGVSVQWYGSGANFVTGGPMLMGVGERGPERVTVTPLRPGAGASSGAGGGGATYNLTYVDQRTGGGIPDLLGVARQLEWQARMGI